MHLILRSTRMLNELETKFFSKRGNQTFVFPTRIRLSEYFPNGESNPSNSVVCELRIYEPVMCPEDEWPPKSERVGVAVATSEASPKNGAPHVPVIGASIAIRRAVRNLPLGMEERRSLFINIMKDWEKKWEEEARTTPR